MNLTPRDMKIRSSGIGSSEISAIACENPYAGPHDVWLRKLGLVEDQGETDATWLGHQMEPIIARRYMRELGVRFRRGGGSRRHPRNSWQVATADYVGQVNGEQRIAECKWVGGRVQHHWNMEADGAPPYVQIQVQWQMGVLGIRAADVAVIFGATAEFRVYQFAFDADMFSALTELGRRFWEGCVLTRVPPRIDETEAARKSLLAVYGFNRAPLKDAPPEAEEWIAKRVEADAALKSAEKAKALATNKLCELIGEAEGIRTDTHYATWKVNAAGNRVFRLAEWKKGRKAA